MVMHDSKIHGSRISVKGMHGVKANSVPMCEHCEMSLVDNQPGIKQSSQDLYSTWHGNAGDRVAG